MTNVLYRVKGPGGLCVLNEEQAKAKEGLKGWEVLGIFEPASQPAPKPEESAEEPVEDDGEDKEDLLADLKPIRSNAELAEFIEANEIEIDPAEYDGFKELKEAVAEKISG